MSAICGMFNLDGRPLAPKVLKGMMDTMVYWGPDSSGSWQDGPVGLGHLMLHTTPESLHETLPLKNASGDLVITADARIDNREELFEALGIIHPERTRMPDSAIILKAYEKWGESCPTHLLGDFAFAIWDRKNRQLFCARDHMGIRPLYYYNSPRMFVFATEIKGILGVPGVARRLNEQSIADFLVRHYADRESTFHEDIFRLTPAHAMMVRLKGLKREAYWALDRTREIELKSDADYIESFQERLYKAVGCRLRSAYPIGAELSGGLDSSSIVSIAARKLRKHEQSLITFSHVLPKDLIWDTYPLKDERSFIDMVCSQEGVEAHHFITSEDRDLFENLNRIFWLFDGPPMSFFAVFSDELYETAARKGVRVLLSGFGGDELISSQGSGYLEELAAQGQWVRLWREVQAHSKRKGGSALRILMSIGLWRLPPWMGSAYRRLLKKDWQYKFIKSNVMHPAFSKRMGTEKRSWEGDRTPTNRESVRARQYAKISAPYIVALVEARRSAASFQRIEYCYPLIDVRLLEFYLSVPTKMKVRNGWGRYLLRQSMEDILPKQIQWRDDKTRATIPSYLERTLKGYEKISGRLAYLSRQKTSDPYIDIEKIKQVLEHTKTTEKSPNFYRIEAASRGIFVYEYLRVPSNEITPNRKALTST